jgi:hypothetical protein
MMADQSSNGYFLLVLGLNVLLAAFWLRPMLKRWGLGLIVSGSGLVLLAGSFLYQGHVTASLAAASAVEAVTPEQNSGSVAQPYPAAARPRHRMKKHKKARRYVAPTPTP